MDDHDQLVDHALSQLTYQDRRAAYRAFVQALPPRVQGARPVDLTEPLAVEYDRLASTLPVSVISAIRQTTSATWTYDGHTVTPTVMTIQQAGIPAKPEW